MRKSFFGFVVVTGVFVASAACSEKAPIIQRVYLDTIMKPGSNPAQKCQVGSGAWLRIGEAADKAVEDGASYDNGAVTVQCRVVPEGDAFSVNLTTQLKGAGDEKNGSVTIEGRFRADGKQEGIRATFANGQYGSFVQDDCTVEYTGGTPQGVAAGRVWGVITCPKITNDSQDRVCEGTGEFKFENCSQL